MPHGSVGHYVSYAEIYWVFWEKDLKLNYFLGKIPLTSQEGFEPEEIFKFCDSSDTENVSLPWFISAKN